MSDSKIEWTDKVWNPVIGCAKVSAGCKHCYAETVAAGQPRKFAARGLRSPYLDVITDAGRWNGRAVTMPDRLAEPPRWRAPQRVFVNSMSDLFHADVPFEYIAAVFGVMAAAPRHTFQVLTKRPARMLEFFAHVFGLEDTPTTVAREAKKHGVIWDARGSDPSNYGLIAGPSAERIKIGQRRPWSWPLPNVWLGVSTEDQATADERIPLLLAAPVAVRFISAEPLLRPIDLHHACCVGGLGKWTVAAWGKRIDWVIVGGESGPGARPMAEAWAASLRDQCAAAGTAFFFKQWGGVNKKSAGRLLDGRTHDAFPGGAP